MAGLPGLAWALGRGCHRKIRRDERGDAPVRERADREHRRDAAGRKVESRWVDGADGRVARRADLQVIRGWIQAQVVRRVRIRESADHLGRTVLGQDVDARCVSGKWTTRTSAFAGSGVPESTMTCVSIEASALVAAMV